MRYTKALLACLVLGAAGFAGAAIVNGGSLAASLQGSGTVTTVTTPTSTTPRRKVTICHRTHSKKNPGVTITVSQNALPAHLRHGDTLGPCPTSHRGKKSGEGHSHHGSKPARPGKGDDAGKPDDSSKADDHGKSGDHGNNGNNGNNGHEGSGHGNGK